MFREFEFRRYSDTLLVEGTVLICWFGDLLIVNFKVDGCKRSGVGVWRHGVLMGRVYVDFLLRDLLI